MNHPRLVALLTGHALSEGRPGAPDLRRAAASTVAAHLEAGRLHLAAPAAGLAPDLGVLAARCPGAVAGAIARLRAVPDRLLLGVGAIELALYVLGIGLVQLMVAVIVVERTLPLLGGRGANLLVLVPVGLGAALVAVAWGLAALRFAVPLGYAGPLGAARHAALAAAVVEAEADTELRRALARELGHGHEHAKLVDLELEQERQVELARAAAQRLDGVLRLLGLGGLAVAALGVLGTVYSQIAWMPVGL